MRWKDKEDSEKINIDTNDIIEKFIWLPTRLDLRGIYSGKNRMQWRWLCKCKIQRQSELRFWQLIFGIGKEFKMVNVQWDVDGQVVNMFRWKIDKTAIPYNTRVIQKFIWWPTKLNGETIWLEKTWIFQVCSDNFYWVSKAWTDKDYAEKNV